MQNTLALYLLGITLMCSAVYPTVASCGRDYGGHVTIHGGWRVQDQRRWPWMVSLQWKNTGSHFCSGTLIDSSWVVTAAHCVDTIFSEKRTHEVKLVFGSLNLNVPETSRITRNISQVHIHPNYVYNSTNPLYIINDLALLRISGTINLTSHVQPACLPDPNPVFYRNCHAVGWGRRSMWEAEGGPLKETRVLTFPSASCARAHPAMSAMIRGGNFICAMGFLGGRICKGDSGGPLLCKVGLATTWTLVGVASWTTGTCSFNETPFGFAEVKHFVRWIKGKTNSLPGLIPNGNLTVPVPPASSSYGPVVALPGGEVLVAVTHRSPQIVVRLDQHGRMVPPAFTSRTIDGLVLDGDDVYVVQQGGFISQTRVSSLNHTLAEWRVPHYLPFTRSGTFVGDELYMVNPRYGIAYSFNLGNKNRTIKQIGFRRPTSIASASTNETGRLFIISENRAHRLSIFNATWNRIRTIGPRGGGGGDGQLKSPEHVLVTPWSTLLVADTRNDRVTEFSLSGRWLRHLLTSRDGLKQPFYVSYSRPYLWVVHRPRGSVSRSARRYQLDT